MKYEVKSEFVDQRTGERYIPAVRGAEPVLFETDDDEQHQRLVKAGCLGVEPSFVLNAKPVEDLTRAELETVAFVAIRAELAKASDDELRASVERYRDSLDEDDGDLTKKTVDQLKEVAADEEVDLGTATKKADIIAAIEAKRNA